ncbi:MAG: hypothetical protein RQ798_03440 [Candidatus Caldarchaeales archaeon]|jgi:hypothetical protein|nr:hypothetical protein [Candidatus Caldarchaeales archaeon]MDT7915579.1 hypothetical protein [Candidatus Caldarchaeales archaeon]
MCRVFVDFGRNRVYALPEDGGEVVVFNDFLEMFGKLRPKIVVADSYPRRLLPTITRLDGAAFLTTPIPLWDPHGGLGRRFYQWWRVEGLLNYL